MTEIIARRQFAPGYIYFDLVFLFLFGGLLLFKKKYMTFLVGFCMGLVYMAVDYGIFHLLCHSRSITGSYHGYMAAILFIGYLGVICFNLTQPEKGMLHSHSAAADNRHSCPVGLGEHSASGQHPQRRLFGCKKAQILVKKIASRKLVLYNEE